MNLASITLLTVLYGGVARCVWLIVRSRRAEAIEMEDIEVKDVNPSHVMAYLHYEVQLNKRITAYNAMGDEFDRM